MKPGDLVKVVVGDVTLWRDSTSRYAVSCGMMRRGELGIVAACAHDPERGHASVFRDQLLVLKGELLGWGASINFMKVQ